MEDNMVNMVVENDKADDISEYKRQVSMALFRRSVSVAVQAKTTV